MEAQNEKGMEMKNYIEDEQGLDWVDFQNGVLEWAEYIDLLKEGDPIKQLSKMQEELDEYKEAVVSGDKDHAAEELIDLFVTGVVSAEQNGLCIIDKLESVLNKLNSRKDTGKMVNGIFVKKEDL